MMWACVQASRSITASFGYREVDRRVFHHLSPRPAPPAPPITITRSPPSLSSKSPPSSRLCVFGLHFRVQRDVLLFTELLLLASPRLLRLPAVQLLYTGYEVAVLVASSQPIVYWWRRWCAWLPQRFGQWSYALRTLYAITALLTVTRHVVARSLVFILYKN